MLRSITRSYFVHNGLRCSIVLGFLMKETWDSRVFPHQNTSGCPDRSHISVSVFHFWKKPSTVIIQTFLSSVLRRSFLIECSWQQSDAVFGSLPTTWLPRSLLSLSFRIPRIFISTASLPWACWNRECTFDGAHAIRLIIGRDLVLTRPSPESCWCLFAIVSKHTVELKWLILNKHNKRFHSSHVKFPLVWMSASWFLVSIHLIWIFVYKLIRSNNQSRATLWVLETCLLVGLLPLMIILITASLSSNTYNKICWCADWTFEGTETMSLITSIFFWDLWRLWTSLPGCPDLFWNTRNISKNRLNPIIPEQANHLILVQCPKRWFQILLNCGKQQFVSCTSNFLEQMYDFRRCTMFLQKWISNLQDLPRNQSLETVPVCIAWQYYPHDNIVYNHMYDEYKKSIDSGVCHKPWSILWLSVQAYSLTIEYQVVQFVPSKNILEQFGSILVKILQQISFLLLWSGGHRCME